MRAPRAHWSHWFDLLSRLKLEHFAVWFLEAGGPLALLGAQALYFSAPFLGSEQIDSLARTLEERNEVQALANFLRERSGP
jgi:hypothetical protein